jgi:hypothetical protein
MAWFKQPCSCNIGIVDFEILRETSDTHDKLYHG